MFDYDTDTGEIWLYDEIGPAWAGMIDASAMLDALRQMDRRDVTLRVSSPGGSVFDAVDIFNAIDRYQGRVTAVIDSLAASAASFLVLAADEVRAASNSMLMIHNAWGVTIGNKSEHQKSIDLLDKVDATITAMYSSKTSRSVDEITAAMDAETWFTATEALEFGLIDAIGEASDIRASVPKGRFHNTPAALLVEPEPGSKTPASYFKNREKARWSRFAKPSKTL